MKHSKLGRWRMLPLKYKLSVYFMVFSLLMLAFLWVFQMVFLEPCYTLIKKYQVSDLASGITRSVREGSDSVDGISDISRENEMSVYIYDSSDAILVRKYSGEFNNPLGLRDIDMHRVYSYYRSAYEAGGKYTATAADNEESLNISFSSRSTDDEETVNLRKVHKHAQNLIYAEIIPLNDSSERFVLITAMVTPVSSVTGTIFIQLIVVTVIFIVFALVLAFKASNRISKPLVEINLGVKELARQNYDIRFNSYGYLEVKELSDTLNLTRRELRRAENLRRELIANISHDLRTPLTMITGYGEVIRDLPGENTPENIQVIIDEANRLSDLVTDMLDLSKMSAGAITLEREDFSLTEEIYDIFQRYTKLKEQEGYDIRFTADKNAYVSADRVKMGQVIYNFINNAINHCGEDKQVIVVQKTSDRRVRVEVIDHGGGIDEDKLDNIWDRYYKVDKEHKRGVIGTGLGLSIVKNILVLHGAQYGVISKPNVGSTFWFELPCLFSEPMKKD